MMRKFAAVNRLYVFKEHKEQPDSDGRNYVLDRLVTYGSVNKVVDEILAFHDEVGPFGELVYAGMDWVDPALTKRSMELMATEVMPASMRRSLLPTETCKPQAERKLITHGNHPHLRRYRRRADPR